MSDNEYLLLKWGTLKGCNFPDNETALDLLRQLSVSRSLSAMAQHDTLEQKDIICKLIDACDGEISNDWSGEVFTKEAAKKYVMDYGKDIFEEVKDRT